jgi:hypothetical protein
MFEKLNPAAFSADKKMTLRGGNVRRCESGRAARFSQNLGFPQHLLPQEPMQRMLGGYLHAGFEQILQIQRQSGVIHQAAIRFPFDKKIKIAVRPGFPSGDRSEYPWISCAMLPEQAKNLR